MTAKLHTFANLLLVSFFVLLLAGIPSLSPYLSCIPQDRTNSQAKPSFQAFSSPVSEQGEELPLKPAQTFLPSPGSAPPLFGDILVVYGEYVNESGQEPVTPWVTFFLNLGFNASGIHINALANAPSYDVLVVTPSVGMSGLAFGVSLSDAQHVMNTSQPILLLGYAHEVLDLLAGFNPATDFIPSLERYLWSAEPSLQIYNTPHEIPSTQGRFPLYTTHITYDAYRPNSLPVKTEVLGTNFDGSGVQLLWYRAISSNPHIYYWGLDQVGHLTDYGGFFCENLLLWLLRPTFQQRLGATLASLQLAGDVPVDYWQLHGAGGFGYPLEPSLRFTYYVTSLVSTHGLDVNTTPFGSWLHDTFNSTLGYFEDLASSQLLDRCITTSMSVLTAQYLGILYQFNISQIGDYIASCQDSITGGFFTGHGAASVNLVATRFAVEALHAIDQLNKINTSAVISFVSNCQELDSLSSEYGGFYSTSSGGIVASLMNVQDALIILSVLGELDSFDDTSLIGFLAGCEEPPDSGIFDVTRTMSSDYWVLGTALAIQILTVLNETSVFDISNGRAFIVANQYPNGGWGRGDAQHDFHNSPDETWFAVQGLAPTGGLGSCQDGLTQYLRDCSTGWGGATEPISFGDFLTSVQIISALNQADALSAVNITAFLEYLIYCWSSPRTSFTAHQLPPGVSADTDTPTPDRVAIEAATFGPLYHYAFAILTQILPLTGDPWSTWALQIRQEIEASQTFEPGYRGMFGLHHLYIGRESDLTFRFDTTCWDLLAHQRLGGHPGDLINATTVLEYLLSCLHGNTTHQYFYDSLHSVPLPEAWRIADGYLAETWLGLQAVAYLDPTCNGLDGQRIATYASQFLLSNLSLITAFYATEILYLLADIGLYPAALTLLNHDSLKTYLMDAFTYQGSIKDSSLPSGKWLPYQLDLALKLSHRLSLYPLLDCNPILNLSNIHYPSETLTIGESVSFNATANELRWNLQLANITVTANIFDTSFTNSCDPHRPGLWHIQTIIPAKVDALGPQNLTLIAIAPGAVPCYLQYTEICEVKGNITVLPSYAPGLNVPRSIPLNISVQLSLSGATPPESLLSTGNISVVIETVTSIYYLPYQDLGWYTTLIPTNTLEAKTYTLFINASAPYCTPIHTTVFLNIVVFTTNITLEQTLPAIPILFEPVTLCIRLQNDSGTPLIDYQINFNITTPGGTTPYLMDTSSTNESGTVIFSWVPNQIGQWQVDFVFTGNAMYNASEGSTSIHVNPRPLTCTIQQFPSSTLFVGNQSYVEVEVSDGLNGSRLSGLIVSLFEDTALLDTAVTNVEGQATCEWLATTPLGSRSLRIEITETTTHAQWMSNLQFFVRDTTTATVTANTTQLFMGETLDLTIQVMASLSTPPDGMASLFWDGQWQHDFVITQGLGHTSLFIPYVTVSGDHILVVIFGHLDDPDAYTECSTSLLITVKPVIRPTLTLTVNPLEIENPLLTPIISIEVQITYTNGSLTQGLIADLTLELRAEDASLLYSMIFITNSQGFYLLELNTPPPGIYTLSVEFPGQREFAPCSRSTPLLVRVPINPINNFFSPLVLVSLAILGVGIFLGSLSFILLRKRLHQILELFTPELEREVNPMDASNADSSAIEGDLALRGDQS
ncbi:MAG: prenyltransferase/squalene oxidase repeat-containing protein [Candidatus Hodarchaeota archaeon]